MTKKKYPQTPEAKARKKEYQKEYYQRPEVKEHQKEYRKEYQQRPEVKERQKEYQQRPEYKASHSIRERARLKTPKAKEHLKEYYQRPEVKERQKEYQQRPEVKERLKEYRKEYQQTTSLPPPSEWTHEATRALLFGKLDEYFAMMMKGGDVDDKEKDVYELAVRAFINDLAYNGLPHIRRERYNREFRVGLMVCGLIKPFDVMMSPK
ncbi:MAG: hypothetical protein NTW33_10400 [Methanoregula sp.]|nr:hypothetical protein [Methanoregula sp.]